MAPAGLLRGRARRELRPAAVPSDHTTAATAIGLGLLLLTPFRKLGVLALAAAVLIGFARVFVGIHWPIDVAGGLLTGTVGAAIAWGAALLISRQRPSTIGKPA